MELLPIEIQKQLPQLYSQDDVVDPICHLKIFTPDSSFTWFITEGTKQKNGDWMLFAKVVSHICPDGELGYVLLSELETIKGSMGLPVERDLYWNEKPISECN